jgi:hypothetical protein
MESLLILGIIFLVICFWPSQEEISLSKDRAEWDRQDREERVRLQRYSQGLWDESFVRKEAENLTPSQLERLKADVERGRGSEVDKSIYDLLYSEYAKN